MPSLNVLDSTMAYREAGSGMPVVFLHGNPTSSYLWRKVLPVVAPHAHVLAPDFIGMGDSGKPAIPYRFADNARYFEAWLDALNLTDLVLVGIDWGGALALDLARRQPERVRGIALMETILRPLTWEGYPAGGKPIFEAIRTPGTGEEMVLDQDQFLEFNLPRTVQSGLSDTDWAEYRRPYPTPESRHPLLQWPRELPIDGSPTDVHATVLAYGEWLATSDTPKLLLTFEGGTGLMGTPEVAEWSRLTFNNLEIVACGVAGHQAPEDQPDAIANAIVSWATRNALFSAAVPAWGTKVMPGHGGR